MSLKLLKVITPGVLAVTLIACGYVATRPIHKVENAPIKVLVPYYDLADVTKAIRSAGIELGWNMQKVMPGHIVGTFDTGKHAATVDITYTLKEYSIHFKSVRNLHQFDDRINGVYNIWVQYLTVAIEAHLITL